MQNSYSSSRRKSGLKQKIIWYLLINAYNPTLVPLDLDDFEDNFEQIEEEEIEDEEDDDIYSDWVRKLFFSVLLR